MLSKEDEINKKMLIVKNILDNVYEILNLFKPLMDKMLKMDEANQYKVNGTFERAASLFGEISDYCKEIENSSIPPDTFLENLGN
jgi:hypothetical protein